MSETRKVDCAECIRRVTEAKNTRKRREASEYGGYQRTISEKHRKRRHLP